MLNRLWTTSFVCMLGVCSVLAACREDATDSGADAGAELVERATRFDDMKEGPPRVRASKRSVNAAVIKAQRSIGSTMDRSLTHAAAAILAENPQSLEAAAAKGEIVGVVQRDGTQITLRLEDEKGPVFASFRAPRLEVQPCWSSIWQPEWLPAPTTGTGVGLAGESQYAWWRFEDKSDLPFLVRFGPEGIAIWRPDEGDDCYRGESLLGLIGGGLSTEEYLSPVAPTDGAQPDETEETDGTKPLRIDILPPKGKEELIARDGVVELRTARKKRMMRWKTKLRGAACTRAAYHRFLGDPVKIYFEIEFSDDEACDEGYATREIQQSLYELIDKELVPVVSGSIQAGTDKDDSVTTGLSLDVRIPTGDGKLRYVGSGGSVASEVGGEDLFDCGPWASDQGYDIAETGYSRANYSGQWTFELADRVVDVGPVKASAQTYSCHEATPE